MANPSTANAGVEGTSAAGQLDGKDGIVGSVLMLSIGMVESSVRTSANIARTLTEETHKITEAVLQAGEQGSQAALRTARKLGDLSFGLISDGINRVEQAALVTIGYGQHTSERVSDLAGHASQAAASSRGLQTKPGNARA